ncbi:hypothetical protein [Endozoicomonas sp. ALB115]|uniref:hypothetical protein n=1 Tax=Endozoicomonas sp. ALB115 TaxID=3403074 RepID=UPI003BB4F381
MSDNHTEPELWPDQDNDDLTKVIDMLKTMEKATEDFTAKGGFRTASLALESLVNRNEKRKKSLKKEVEPGA